MTMKLYGFWRSLATYRVRAALALKGIEVEQISINLLQGKQHAEEYKAINPQSVVPALVIDGGLPLFQSMAILEYLEETYPIPALLPKDPRGRARVRGLAVKGGSALSRKDVDQLAAAAKQLGGAGLAWAKRQGDQISGSVGKHFTAEVLGRLGAGDGDAVLLTVGPVVLATLTH